MPSAATTMAAAPAGKKAFIVFHLVGLAECESKMPGYVWCKDADRHDGSSLTGPHAFFATEKHGDTIQSALQKGRGVLGVPTNVRQWGERTGHPNCHV
jgi:hypothetical protein